MALDNAQFISELSITDPPGTDELSEGDDQIRTTKRATFQSFPNVDAQVTLTAAQLNDVALQSEANTFTQQQDYFAGLVMKNANSLFGETLIGTPFPLAFMSNGNVSTFGNFNTNMALQGVAEIASHVDSLRVARFLPNDSGSLVIEDIGGTERKVGFRNPNIVPNPTTITQADEQTVLRFTGSASHNLTVPALEIGTNITIIVEVDAGQTVTLTPDGGVTLSFLDGGGAASPQGARVISQTSIVQLEWVGPNFVNIWGNGIT